MLAAIPLLMRLPPKGSGLLCLLPPPIQIGIPVVNIAENQSSPRTQHADGLMNGLFLTLQCRENALHHHNIKAAGGEFQRRSIHYPGVKSPCGSRLHGILVHIHRRNGEPKFRLCKKGSFPLTAANVQQPAAGRYPKLRQPIAGQLQPAGTQYLHSITA